MIPALPPYPATKDSGIPWLGRIPAHWEMERAKWLFRKMERPVREQDEVITCFRDGVVTLRKNRRTRGFTESLKEIGYQGIRRGDLVIHAMDAFAGAIGVSDSDGKGSPVYAVCRPEYEANAYFYAYLLREMARSQWIVALAKGIRERSTDFRYSTFSAEELLLPPLPEQRLIARYLDWADARIRRLIAARERQAALLEETKQALIHQAVTGQIDVRTGQPYAEYKDSGVAWLGRVPGHWEIRRLKQVSGIVRGKFTHRPRNDPALYGGDYPFIQTGDVARAKKVISSYTQTLNEKGLAVSRIFPAGILLMTIAANIGDVAILGFDACFPDSVVGFIPSKDIKRDYLYLIFHILKPELVRDAPVNTQGNLNVERIGVNRIVLPPYSEQASIVTYLENRTAEIDTAIVATRSAIDLLKEYRTRLIADVVTGKIDVREVAGRIANPPWELSSHEPNSQSGGLASLTMVT